MTVPDDRLAKAEDALLEADQEYSQWLASLNTDDERFNAEAEFAADVRDYPVAF